MSLTSHAARNDRDTARPIGCWLGSGGDTHETAGAVERAVDEFAAEQPALFI